MSVLPGAKIITMKPEAYEGALGHLIIMQEWPDLKSGESYLRLMINMGDAVELANTILDIARKAKK